MVRAWVPRDHWSEDWEEQAITRFLHSAIGYITPADKLAGRAEEIFAARDRKLEAARHRRAESRQRRRAQKTLKVVAATNLVA